MQREPQWQVQVFGQFRLEDPNGVSFSTRSDRARILLAHLALKKEMGSSRAAVESILFDDELGRSAPNLALLLTRLKASLSKHPSPSPLVVRPARVALDKSMICSDLGQFEQLLERVKSQFDPLAKGSLLVEALKLVTGRPVPDLDHPLLTSDRSRIERMILTAMGELASGPLGPQHRDLLLPLLEEFADNSLYDPVQFESVLMVYGGLGLKENLVAAFTKYEGLLDEEYGESPRSQLTALFNELLAKLDSGTSIGPGQVPQRPRVTFGREEDIETLTQHIEQKRYGVIGIVGQSGVGKSHLLKSLYWLITGDRKCAYFDFESVLPEAVPDLLNGKAIDVLFLDHLGPESLEVVLSLRKANPSLTIVTAGHITTQLSDEFILLLSTLDPGSNQYPGPAARFVASQIEAVKGATTSIDPEKIVELAELCNGLPLALEVAGRLAATIGLDGTLGAWKRDPLGVHGALQSLDRHKTLDHAILSSFVHLSQGAKRVVHTLTLLEGECHVDLLIYGLKVQPREFEEAVLSGLVIAHQMRPTVSLMKLTESVILTHETELGLDPRELLSFFRTGSDWFLDRLGHTADAVSIAYCLPLALRTFRALCESGERIQACRLFMKLKLWFGSCPVSTSEIDRCATFLNEVGSEGVETWAQCRLTLGAGYYHRGSYQQLLSAADETLSSPESTGISAGTQCHLEMQRALGWRCLGDTSKAFEAYKVTRQKAFDLGEQSILVTVCFNLGSLAESLTRFDEAYTYFEESADNINAETDPRLEGTIHLALGRVMLRLRRDPKEAEMILDAALFHAKGRKDTKLVYDLMSSLATAYYLRDEYLLSCAASLCAGLLRARHEPEFEVRRQGTSGLTLVCWDFLELGFEELAVRARALLDRFEVTDTAVLWADLRRELEARTYVTPTNLKTRPLSISEYRTFLEEATETVYDLHGDNPKVASFVSYVTADDSAWSRMMKSKPSWSWKTKRPSSVSSHSHSYT